MAAAALITLLLAHALLLAAAGEAHLYIGGSFRVTGGANAYATAQLARNSSDAEVWAPLPIIGNTLPLYVYALAEFGGELIAGGYFSMADVGSVEVVSYNGNTWRSWPRPSGNRAVDMKFAVVESGTTLFAAPTVGSGYGESVYRWTGSGWSALNGRTDDGTVRALVEWRGRLHVAGSFRTIGDATANRVAAWATNAWAAVGAPGLDGIVNALAVVNDTLVVGGQLLAAGGADGFNHVAAWTGSAWQRLGVGVNSEVYALLATNGGAALYASGAFTTAGGLPANRVAVWDGAAWAPLGSGLDGSTVIVYALAWYKDALIVAGRFSLAGGVTVSNVARWNGTKWSDVAGGVSSGYAYALVTSCDYGWAGSACDECARNFFGPECQSCAPCEAHGTCHDGLGGQCVCDAGWAGPLCTVCAADHYGPSCTDCSVCRAHGACREGLDGNCTCDLGWGGSACTVCAAGWGGGNCSDCVDGYYGPVCATCELCEFHGTCREGRDEGGCDCAPGWTGPACTTCSETGGCGQRAAVDVYVGGSLYSIDGMEVSWSAHWNGTTWDSMDGGLSNPIETLVGAEPGSVYVGGTFAYAQNGRVPMEAVALWNQETQTFSAAGSNTIAGTASTMLWFDNELVVCGGIYIESDPTLYLMAKLGADDIWAPFGTDDFARGGYRYIMAMASGEVGGRCGVFVGASDPYNPNPQYTFMWDGYGWSRLGSAAMYYYVDALLVHDGTLLVGCQYTVDGGATYYGLAVWDGTSWSGTGLRNTDYVRALTEFNGNVYAAGAYTNPVDGVQSSLFRRYRGEWRGIVPSPPLASVASLSADAHWLYIVGYFQDFVGDAGYLARWNGTDWQAMADEISVGISSGLYFIQAADVSGAVQRSPCTVGPAPVAGNVVVIVSVSVAAVAALSLVLFAAWYISHRRALRRLEEPASALAALEAAFPAATELGAGVREAARLLQIGQAMGAVAVVARLRQVHPVTVATGDDPAAAELGGVLAVAHADTLVAAGDTASAAAAYASGLGVLGGSKSPGYVRVAALGYLQLFRLQAAFASTAAARAMAAPPAERAAAHAAALDTAHAADTALLAAARLGDDKWLASEPDTGFALARLQQLQRVAEPISVHINDTQAATEGTPLLHPPYQR